MMNPFMDSARLANFEKKAKNALKKVCGIHAKKVILIFVCIELGILLFHDFQLFLLSCATGTGREWIQHISKWLKTLSLRYPLVG